MRLKQLENVDYAIIHCSATPPSMDIGKEEITRWHKERGWLTIGYHYVIRRDGALETGRRLGTMGAHAVGYNDCSVGICMVGGSSEEDLQKPEDNFTEAQWKCLESLVAYIKEVYPNIEVIGHRDVSHKACPSFDAKAWYAEKFD